MQAVTDGLAPAKTRIRILRAVATAPNSRIRVSDLAEQAYLSPRQLRRYTGELVERGLLAHPLRFPRQLCLGPRFPVEILQATGESLDQFSLTLMSVESDLDQANQRLEFLKARLNQLFWA